MGPSQQQIDNLLELYQAGKYDDAKKLAGSLTEKFPTHTFSWKVLGAVLKKTGKINEALIPMQRSVQLSPQDAEAHSNLGVILKELGRLEEAEASYRKAIILKLDYAEAHSNLAVILQKLIRLDEAEENCRKAIILKPDYAEAHSNLGNILKEQGRLKDAEANYRKAIILKPDLAEAHSNLGNILKEQGRLKDAVANYRKAITLKPDLAEAHSNLGVILKELGRLKEAEANYRKAIILKPDYAEAHSNLGITLQEQGRLEEAETSYKKAITLKPDLAETYNNLGITLQEQGRLEEAETNLGKAITLKPDFAEAHRHLTVLKKFYTQDQQYLKMQELLLSKNISEEERCNINFGLAKASEDLEDFEQAFQHYREGNEQRKKLLNYDMIQDIELFKQLKSSYPRIEQNSLEVDNLANKLMPIFIVGMPRSGTTLVEQIISSHPQVTGAGELSFADHFGKSIAIGSSAIDKDSILNFRVKYLTKLKNISNGNLIVTDKMPQNFRYIGLLAAAFPEAKIVHVKRNPAAVCWSNYKQYFANKNLSYSYGLGDTISYHKLYENLMQFWGNLLGKRIYNLDYEMLTEDQENETRKLINYISLNWEEKCLYPQDNMRPVHTASDIQVRKKIYQGSSQQWGKYKPFLNGALDCFENLKVT